MDLKERIELLVEVHGSLRTVASLLNIDVGYLSRLSSGKLTNPSVSVLTKLGLRRVVTYELIKTASVNKPYD